MTYTYIVEHCSDLPVEQCCTTLKVSRSALCAWQKRQAHPTLKMVDDADLTSLIGKIHDQSFGAMGHSG